MSVYGYLRVSTREQADSGLGLEAQRRAVLDECLRRQWDVAGWFCDEGASAATLKRPALTEALTTLRRGDVLVSAKVDRLSRSLHDFTGLMETARDNEWALVALDSPADMTTPEGEMLVSMLGVFAQFERRLISRRTKDALAELKAQGVKLGRPSAMPPELRERIVALAATNGYSGTARLLNAEGVPTVRGGERWWPSTVRQVVT